MHANGHSLLFLCYLNKQYFHLTHCNILSPEVNLPLNSFAFPLMYLTPLLATPNGGILASVSEIPKRIAAKSG